MRNYRNSWWIFVKHQHWPEFLKSSPKFTDNHAESPEFLANCQRFTNIHHQFQCFRMNHEQSLFIHKEPDLRFVSRIGKSVKIERGITCDYMMIWQLLQRRYSLKWYSILPCDESFSLELKFSICDPDTTWCDLCQSDYIQSINPNKIVIDPLRYYLKHQMMLNHIYFSIFLVNSSFITC